MFLPNLVDLIIGKVANYTEIIELIHTVPCTVYRAVTVAYLLGVSVH